MLRVAPPLFALGCFLLCLRHSWHWPLVHDAAIMHYVVLLMDHGVAPYRDIIDINMPGAYMGEWLVVHTLGPGSFAWRMYDLLIMLAATGAMCYIAAPWDWLAGAFAGLVLGIFHMANGAIELGQRDYTIMALVLLGFAFLFSALRRSQPWVLFGFGLAFSAATCIKPLVAPFPILLFLLAGIVLRRSGQRLRSYIAATLAGAGLPVLASALFLLRWHAFRPFLTLFRGLVVFYAGIGNVSYAAMLEGALGRFVFGLMLLALLLSLLRGSFQDHETIALALGILFGLYLFLGQHKGFIQHKATFMAFVLLWIAVQSYPARPTGRQPSRLALWLGAFTLLLCCFWTGHRWTRVALVSWPNETAIQALEAQLRPLNASTLPAASLDRNIQCVEMVQGCLNALYRMRLVQTTGFLSDFFLFTPQKTPMLDGLRARFLSELTSHPPRVLVVAALGWGGGDFNYTDLGLWPEFSAFLRDHYSLASEHRTPPDEPLDRDCYRLYLRRDL